ncbi:MAG: hypothetical protein IJ881_02470 [Neisseriaceae bacterium]|nr:hypothetical protein [Neisseriaceae bacterium]
MNQLSFKVKLPTVSDNMPFLYCDKNDTPTFRQPEKSFRLPENSIYLTTAVATSTVTPKPIVLDTAMRLMY